MLGFEADALHGQIRLAPHFPADWTGFQAHNLHMQSATYDVSFSRDDSSILLEYQSRNTPEFTLEFAPAISPRAKVMGVEVNGRKAPYSIQNNATDQHVVVRSGWASGTIRIRLRDDFALAVPSDLPPLGAESRNLKLVSESWNAARDSVVYDVAGISGREYELPARGPAQIARVEGGEIVQTASGRVLRIRMPAGEPGYRHAGVTIHFSAAR